MSTDWHEVTGSKAETVYWIPHWKLVMPPVALMAGPAGLKT